MVNNVTIVIVNFTFFVCQTFSIVVKCYVSAIGLIGMIPDAFWSDLSDFETLKAFKMDSLTLVNIL